MDEPADCGRGPTTKPPQQGSRFKAFVKRTWKKLYKKAQPPTLPKGKGQYSTTTATRLYDTDATNTSTDGRGQASAGLLLPQLQLDQESAENDLFEPLLSQSLDAYSERQPLPQASSFYDENVGLRSSLNDSSPAKFGNQDAAYSPVRLHQVDENTWTNGVVEGSAKHPKADNGFKGRLTITREHSFSSMFEDYPDSDAFSEKETSFSHLQETVLKGKKSLRSSQLAAKVFGIAELLEAILLAAYNPGDAPHNKPWRWLYTTQRVNKAFLATITGSSKLKRLMWLAKSDGDSGNEWSLENQPLGWLLKSAGLWDDVTCNGRREGRRSTGFSADYTIRFQVRDYRVQELLSRLKFSQALAVANFGEPSWRAMQTCKWQVVPKVRFEFQYITGTAYETLVPLRRHDRIHWVLEPGKKLGHVYDILRQMLQMYDDHRARVEEILTMRAREDKQREDRLQQALKKICGN